MTTDFFKSMLVLLPTDFRSPDLDRALSNAIAVSRWIRAELHFIIPYPAPILEDKLQQYGFEPRELARTIHGSTEDLYQDIHDFVRRRDIDLVMFGMDSIPIEEEHAQAWRNLLLQIADVPVLICPIELDLMATPVQSLLVPMSGEPRISASLEVALRLANDVKLPVDLVHVTDLGGVTGEQPAAIERVSERIYHEYPRLIEQLIAQSSPYSGLRERLVIRDFQHVCGDIAAEVVKCVEKRTSCLLVLEWKGSLASGRARTIKSAMARYSFPILLVREAPKQKSLLKVGNHFEAA